MSNQDNEPGHGHSIAAWTAVITAIVGVTIGTLGVVFEEATLAIIGSLVTVISIPLGPVLAKLGFGIDRVATSKK